MWHIITTAALIIAVSTFLWSKSVPPVTQTRAAPNFDYFGRFAKIQPILDNTCTFPILAPTEKVALLGEIERCPIMNDIYSVIDEQGILTFTKRTLERRVNDKNQNFTCVYTHVVELIDNENFTVGFGTEIPLEPLVPTFVPNENVLAYCRDYFGNVINIKSYPNFGGKIAAMEKDAEGYLVDFEEADPMKPSLSILMIHNASLNQMVRHLPKTFEFLAANDFISYSMFNLASDDVVENAAGILKGAGDRKDPWLWEYMRDRKCATMLHDDIRTESPFDRNSTSSLGTDFHSRLFHQFNQQHLVNNKTGNHCLLDGRLAVDDYIDIWSSFSKAIVKNCHFSLAFLSDVTAYEESFLQVADVKILQGLAEMKEAGVFENTVIALIADGVEYDGEKELTLRQQIEKRQGAFILRTPEKFVETYPQMAHNLKENANRIISNEDVYATLKDFAMSQNIENQKSLLRRNLPANRTCENAGIRPDLCSCLSPIEDVRNFMEDNGSRILDATREYFSTLLCVDNVKIADAWSVRGFTTRTSNFESADESYDYIDVEVEVKTKKFILNGSQRTITKNFIGRFRRCQADDSLEIIAEYLPKTTPDTTCIIDKSSDFCSSCYYKFVNDQN